MNKDELLKQANEGGGALTEDGVMVWNNKGIVKIHIPGSAFAQMTEDEARTLFHLLRRCVKGCA